MMPQRVTGEAAQPARSGTKRCRRGALPGAPSSAPPVGAARRDGGRTEGPSPPRPARPAPPTPPRGAAPRSRPERRCGTRVGHGAAAGTAGLRSPPAGGTKAVRRGRERPRAEGGGAPSPEPRPPPAAGGAKRGPAAPPAGRRRRSTSRRRPRPLKGKTLLRWNGSPSAPLLGPPRSGSAPSQDTPLGPGVPRPLAKWPRAQPESPRLRNERLETLKATRARSRPGSRIYEVK